MTPLRPPANAAGQAGGRCIAGLLHAVAAAMADAEEELGALDARAGDGDHGQGMARGSAAAAAAAAKAATAGGGAASVLARAGDAWADRAGGTSGALWGLALRSWSGRLSDDEAVTPAMTAAGAQAALEAVVRLGNARPGDKTLVDAFAPFAAALLDGVAAGRPLRTAWQAAAIVAERAAQATAPMTPRLGRARPLAARSIGHADPGAISLALAAAVVGRHLPDA